jgi:hypothetical protein
MDVDPRVEDLTGSEFGDGENSSEDPLSQPGSSHWGQTPLY